MRFKYTPRTVSFISSTICSLQMSDTEVNRICLASLWIETFSEETSSKTPSLWHVSSGKHSTRQTNELYLERQRVSPKTWHYCLTVFFPKKLPSCRAFLIFYCPEFQQQHGVWLCLCFSLTSSSNCSISLISAMQAGSQSMVTNETRILKDASSHSSSGWLFTPRRKPHELWSRCWRTGPQNALIFSWVHWFCFVSLYRK